MFPDDVVLTDLVITRLASSTVPICEVALFEERRSDIQGIQFFYPTQDTPTEELHLVSGLTSEAEAWGVGVNNECVLKVLWSGYTLP